MSEPQDKNQSIQKPINEAPPVSAIARLKQWLGKNDNDNEAHYDLGTLYFAEGKINHALQSFQRCIDLSPENTKYLKSYADVLYTKTENTERALEIYDKILSVCPNDIDILMTSGHLHVSLRQFDEALAFYQRILTVEPSNHEAVKMIDQLNRRKRRPETSDPENEYRKCIALLHGENVGEAIAGLETIVQRHPDFALAQNDLGVLYYRMEDKKRSLHCYEKAVSLEPANPNYRKNLADFYLVEQGRMEEAMELYLSVLKDNPEDIDVLLVAGHICVALGKTSSAITFYERVMDIEPWNFDANDRLDKLRAD